MKNLFIPLLALFFLASCGSSKVASNNSVVRSSNSATMAASSASKVVAHAKSFEGTRYRYGGTDKRGMDCSGLVYVCFKEEAVELPRISRDMALEGTPIHLEDTLEGDLLFFQTSKNNKVINHVGIVVESSGGMIKFIHSTTSSGVIISSMAESYWRNSFIEARRII